MSDNGSHTNGKHPIPGEKPQAGGMPGEETPDTAESEFKDPLSNYEPPAYNDPLEEALGEQPVEAIQVSPYTAVPDDTPVREAVALMARKDIGCLLITARRSGRLVGVLTNRDVVDRVVLEYEAVKDGPVRAVMTRDPVVVRDTQCAAAAVAVMAVCGFRHVPVVDLEDQLVGVISPPRVIDFLQSHLGGA
jgi:CBS domain-containing protein